HIGAELILNTVKLIEKGDYSPIPQNTNQTLKPAPKIFKETCQIDWNKSEEEIYDFVRGLSPYPCSWTKLNDKNYKIISVKKTGQSHSHKDIGSTEQEGNRVFVFCKGGKIELMEIQAEGKKKMKVEDFLRGNKI